MNNCMYFNKHHLRNAIRTLKKYFLVEIEEYYANSLYMEQHLEWKGKLLDYKIESYDEHAQCKLLLHLQDKIKIHEIEFYIPYNSVVKFGDITKGEPYIIDYINSGPHCQYSFKKII